MNRRNEKIQIEIFHSFQGRNVNTTADFHLVLPLLDLKHPLQDPKKSVASDLRGHIVVTEPGSEISDMSAEDMKKMYLSSVF